MSKLQKYGQNLLNDNEIIKNNRKIGIINNYTTFNDDIIKNLNLINLYNYNYKIIEKENYEGFFMKWHVDDAQIIKHNKNNNFTDQIKITDKQYLHYNKLKPSYSLIIYESDFGNDFVGGSFEFSDGTIIFPKKGMYIFFDSREVHRVNKITNGIRKNYLIKFYKNL